MRRRRELDKPLASDSEEDELATLSQQCPQSTTDQALEFDSGPRNSDATAVEEIEDDLNQSIIEDDSSGEISGTDSIKTLFFKSEDSDASEPHGSGPPQNTDTESPSRSPSPGMDPILTHLLPDYENEDIVTKVGLFLMALRGSHEISDSCAAKIYDFFCKEEAGNVYQAYIEDRFPSFRTLQRTIDRRTPEIKVSAKYIEVQGEAPTRIVDALQLPAGICNNRQGILQMVSHTTIEQIFNFVVQLHGLDLERTQKSLIFSCDGVEKSKRGKTTLKIISVRFPFCKQPYPLAIWEYQKGNSPSLRQLYSEMVQELNNKEFEVKQALMDGLEQNHSRGMVSTTGFFGCARCKRRGVTTETRNCRHVHYPPSIENYPLRTADLWEEVYNERPELYFNPEVTRIEPKIGIKAFTPLYELLHFDIVKDIPLDALHLIHIGITKATWERLFTPGKIFRGRKLRDTLEQFDNIMNKVCNG